VIIDTEKLVTVYIEYDCDPECPTEHTGYDVISFNPRHSDFKEPTDEVIEEMEGRVKDGTAFWLDCYQHGSSHWFRHMTGQNCRWDTSYRAGVLLVDDTEGKGNIDRADNFLEIYNQWCNGAVYFYRMTEGGEHIDGCGSYYEPSDLLDEVVGMLQHYKVEQVLLRGDAISVVQPELDQKFKELGIEIIDL
jgi:hypothetical protein